MNPHTSVRKVVRLPARVALNLSRLACGLRLFLTAMAFTPVAHAQIPATPAPSRPLNVILVLRDQTRYELPAAAGYHMPALDRLAQQGITFRNHYIASAMCTPSRAALYSGQPPQVNGVFDQMEAGYVPSLPKDRPNMGSMMKKLGYRTAFYGKWEMDFDILPPKPTVNSSDALQPYGFDIYQPDGDKTGTPDQGYKTDVYTAAESVRWLRGNVSERRQSSRHHVCGCQRAGDAPGTKGRREQCAHRAAEQFVVQQALEHRSFAAAPT
jgi:arylsulfatase A-like enzyme